MNPLTSDALHKVIETGIKDEIEFNVSNRRYRAATILIFAGIDAMAFLDMPASQDDVTRNDFINWVERYVRFPCNDQITGEELYSARCAMVHTYGQESRISRTRKCRVVGYVDRCIPEVRFAPSVDPTQVVVSIEGLKTAFFAGMNEFLISVYSNSEKTKIVEPRLQTMIQCFPVK